MHAVQPHNVRVRTLRLLLSFGLCVQRALSRDFDSAVDVFHCVVAQIDVAETAAAKPATKSIGNAKNKSNSCTQPAATPNH